MQILNLIQGSPEWLQARAQHFCASDAPAMMGESIYKTRSALLAEKKFGKVEEFDNATMLRFANGHAAEASARPSAEAILGEALYPVVCVSDDGKLLASVDGMTMGEDVLFEHKLYNESLAQSVRNKDLGPTYYWQLEHQLLVTGAKTVLFMCSSGADDSKREWMHYVSIPSRRAALIAGWEQFAKDLETFAPEETKVEPVGRAPEQLPALRIEISGAVQASNLAEFKAAAVAVFGNIKKDLVTDEDFADAEKTGKWCAEVESKLDAAKQHALSQTATIDELFRAIDEIRETARQTRLHLEKKVKAEKENRKTALIGSFLAKINEHYAPLEAAAGFGFKPVISSFHECIKGLKTLTSMRDKLDVTLMQEKIRANEIAGRIEANRKLAESLDAMSLVPDFKSLATKEEEDFGNLVKNRVEQRRQEEEFRRQQQEKMAATTTVAAPISPVQNVKPIAPVEDGRTINVGEICRRLGLVISADFLESLGVSPLRTERNSKIYRESDFPLICNAIARHVAHIGEAHKAKAAA